MTTTNANQYTVWGRTRRLRVAPFLAQTDNIAQDALIINMANLQIDAKNKQNSIFGPVMGVPPPNANAANGAAAWPANVEESSSPKGKGDHVTPDLLKGWLAKSKESPQQTTTLQSLVNLKRPTLRLSPITLSSPSEIDLPSSAPPIHQHGLEFSFDCDSPRCLITVQVHTSTKPATIYTSVVPGGFGKTLKLEDGASLDLVNFEKEAKADLTSAESGANTTAPNTLSPPPLAPTNSAIKGSRNRLSAFPFRRRAVNRADVTGPALAVVDVDSTTPAATAAAAGAAGAAATAANDAKKELEGVKVSIRLEALDEQEQTLTSPNIQVTYLHIIRLGQLPAPESDEGEVEDTRPWVVRVIRRDATIGAHTFRLHEIYGLSSSSGAQTAPAPEPTYPPTAADAEAHTYDFANTECVLCLSAPREVVLLPCRHLVACKECAVNMVEYGAGGQLVHMDTVEPAPVAGAVTAAGEGAEAGAADATAEGEAAGQGTSNAVVAPAPAAPAAPTPSRRKRKAKGWHCPVCRQPYTSLLRISPSGPHVEHNDKLEDADESKSPSPEPNEQSQAAAKKQGFFKSLSSRATLASPSTEDAAAAEV